VKYTHNSERVLKLFTDDAKKQADRIASVRTVASRFHLRLQREKIAEFPSPFPWTGSPPPTEKCLFASGEILSKKLLFWDFVLDLHSFSPYYLICSAYCVLIILHSSLTLFLFCFSHVRAQ
jgi:hypothetical protein